jgi:hypothetical protein
MIARSLETLRDDDGELGEIGIVPWDTQIFGFPVAEFAPANARALWKQSAGLQRMLREYAERNRVALVCARLPALRCDDIAALGDMQFRVVDHALDVRQTRLQRVKIPMRCGNLRPAIPDDLPAIEQIAETSFQFGRYHTDGNFPRHLANRRYGYWVRKAMESLSESNLMLILESGRRVTGFFDVKVTGHVAELKLGAVDIASENGLLGYQLYVGTLGRLQALGVDEVMARISAGNTGVMNLYTTFGFQFSRPEVVLHWHVGNDLCGANAVDNRRTI